MEALKASIMPYAQAAWTHWQLADHIPNGHCLSQTANGFLENLNLKPPAVAALLVLLVSLLYGVSIFSELVTQRSNAPVFGIRSAHIPRMFSSWIFFRNAPAILNGGYDKFRDRAWRFVRADTDMLVLPAKYVDEMRSLPPAIASPTAAHAFNLSSAHTKMDIILKNNLHFRTLQEKLTPNLASLMAPMQDELSHALDLDLPHSEVFVSLVVLRLFPRWLHGLVSFFLPSTWIGARYIRRAKALLAPEIKHRQALATGSAGPDDDAKDSFRGSSTSRDSSREPTLLDWMIEIAQPHERSPDDLAHLEVVMSLASIHTSHMNAVHVLYDLAVHPGFIDELRQEIRSVLAEHGPWQTWDKQVFYKLKKLDSFMRESQRINPPTLLSYHRLILRDHVLADGTLLPRGAHVTMPVNAIQNDADVTRNAHVFDPLRYYRLRQQSGQAHLHQFATTEPRILNFGHGKYACPGRFFAALEIKNILVRLIMDYDWKLPEGQGRPANLHAHEFIFPNQDSGVLFVKKRRFADSMAGFTSTAASATGSSN